MDWCKGECTRNHGEDPHPILGGFLWFPCNFSLKNTLIQTKSSNKQIWIRTPEKSPVLLAKRILDHSCWHRIWNKKLRSKVPSSGNWSTGPCWATASMVASEAKELFTGPMTSAGRASSTAWASSHPAPELSWLTTSALGLMVDAHIYRIYS